MKKHLISLGFKKKKSTDKSCYWYELKIRHKLINKLHITVDIECKSITAWCEEPKDLNGRIDSTFVICQKKLTRLNLKKILTLFEYMTVN